MTIDSTKSAGNSKSSGATSYGSAVSIMEASSTSSVSRAKEASARKIAETLGSGASSQDGLFPVLAEFINGSQLRRSGQVGVVPARLHSRVADHRSHGDLR